MKKIIYILGGGRSGTTLLDIILGSAEDTFSTGEVIKFPELKACPHGFDETTENYRFWKRAESSFKNKFSQTVDYAELFRLSVKMEFHRNFFFNYFNLISRKDALLYSKYINCFFDAVFENTDKNVIIDSSKYPLRALSLFRHLNYDINFIYLIRNPVDVVNSFAKKEVEQPVKNFWAANAYYFAINFLCRAVIQKMKHAKILTVRYDELVENPVKELQKVQDAFQIDMSKTIMLLKSNSELPVGHLFEGNRIRLQKSLLLKTGKPSPHQPGIRNFVTRTLNYCWWKN